jgi:hypothetical protein
MGIGNPEPNRRRPPMTKRTTRTPKLIALGLAAAGLLALPAASQATSFGSHLKNGIQPSNSTPAHECDPNPGAQCTRILLEGYSDGMGVPPPKAQKDGTIDKLRLIAGAPGEFRFLLAHAKPNAEQAKVVYRGQKLSYGSSGNQYKVQTINVNVPVDEGDFLGIEAKKTSMLRCSSGGPNQLIFQPALQLGAPYAQADDTDGCWLLLEAVYE